MNRAGKCNLRFGSGSNAGSGRNCHGLRFHARFSFGTASKYECALEEMIGTCLVETPAWFGYFKETGEPYRAILFSISPRSAYWIIYRVYEDQGFVRVLRFHSASLSVAHSPIQVTAI